MELDSKIYVAGHTGLVGSALVRVLRTRGYHNIITASRGELDLSNQDAVKVFFGDTLPEYVFLAAARVGGIMANSTYPADFIYENLMISANVLWAANFFAAKKVLYLGSSCIYPKMAEQPIKESALMTGPLEPTNSAYAVAKIAGIELSQAIRRQYDRNFICAMPTNLYGPNDNYDRECSHVIPGMMRRIHEANEKNEPAVTLWGTGEPLREFMYVDDLAEALLFLMKHYDESGIVNVGSGQEVSIRALADLLTRIIGYRGKLVFDDSKPDGTPRKALDCSKLKTLGWAPRYDMPVGLLKTYDDFLSGWGRNCD